MTPLFQPVASLSPPPAARAASVQPGADTPTYFPANLFGQRHLSQSGPGLQHKGDPFNPLFPGGHPARQNPALAGLQFQVNKKYNNQTNGQSLKNNYSVECIMFLAPTGEL